MAVTRTFRGISRRLAIKYLENLGGERVDGEVDSDWDIEGNGWHADLSEAKVKIGPSLQLNEVTVVFEGEDDSLEELIPKFAQKAMRAGG